jgi:flavin reductase (DIM6/NTAB) family NADH-FMN oxidoreductase RutF
VFCVNIVAYAMRDMMNVTSGPWPKETDEFDQAGIERAACQSISCSRVAAAPANLECRLTQIVQLPGAANFAVFGEVVGVHIRDDCLRDGRVDVTLYQPLSRLGYRDYARVTEVFSLKRPGE